MFIFQHQMIISRVIMTNSAISLLYLPKLWKYRSQSFTTLLINKEEMNSFLGLNHDMLLSAEGGVVYTNNIVHI